MKKNNKISKWTFLLVLILISIIAWLFIGYNDDINITNVKWNTKGNNCEIVFKIENQSDNLYKLDLLIDLYNHRQSHNDNYQLLGKKNISINLYPSEKKNINESVSIEILNRVTKVQVLIKNKEVL